MAMDQIDMNFVCRFIDDRSRDCGGAHGYRSGRVSLTRMAHSRREGAK
jgi:hypothetical protein